MGIHIAFLDESDTVDEDWVFEIFLSPICFSFRILLSPIFSDEFMGASGCHVVGGGGGGGLFIGGGGGGGGFGRSRPDEFCILFTSVTIVDIDILCIYF